MMSQGMGEAGRGSAITVVSGIPRSGTSMMMRMLVNGGLRALDDGVRQPDVHNPFGYFECQLVKGLRQHPGVVLGARGGCVKVVSELLRFLPEGECYFVIFMVRDLFSVVSSQMRMLGGNVFEGRVESLVGMFSRHLVDVEALIGGRRDMSVLYCGFEDVVSDPSTWAARIDGFLCGGLDVGAMAAAVCGNHGNGVFAENGGDAVALECGEMDRERLLRSLGYL